MGENMDARNGHMTEKSLDLQQNLSDLQSHSIKILGILLGSVGYLWLMGVMWPKIGVQVTFWDWLGSVLCVLTAVLGLWFSQRLPTFGAIFLTLCFFAATLCLVYSMNTVESVYFFALPIIASSALWGTEFIFFISVLICIASTFLLRYGWNFDIMSFSFLRPILFIGVISITSWLSTRNLYTALEWVWNGYETARRNERLAREGQAELRRTLKALDEATYRLERANYMLAIARDQAEEARRLKQQFAQTISHELRTPLNLVISFAELMLRSPEYYGEPLPPKYARDLGIIYRNAQHLLSLINDVLDLARIEAVQMDLVFEETDLYTLMQDSINTVRSLVESRGLALQVDISPDLPRIKIDPKRVRQVLFNLLSNAVRFTEQGSITVRVTRKDDEILFAVSDTGIGIAEKDKGRIFEEFQQAEGGTSRPYGGAGLGLAISKRFVELHKGRIWVESQVGQGSTFYFALPIHQDLALEEQIVPSIPQSSSPRAETPILLAITPNEMAANLLNQYMHGCRTVVVKDVEQAKQAASKLLPQAVVVDTAEKPIETDVLEQLAYDLGLQNIPFLAAPLSAERSEQPPLTNGYLLKPISRENLLDILRRFGASVEKILVVDDDRDFVRLMERLLDSPVRRYQILCAYGGFEGLEMIRRHKPDLVFLDIRLPDLDGYQVLELLRADRVSSNPFVVLVSAQDQVDSGRLLRGSLVAWRDSGFLPGEIIRWMQYIINLPFVLERSAATPLANPAP